MSSLISLLYSKGLSKKQKREAQQRQAIVDYLKNVDKYLRQEGQAPSLTQYGKIFQDQESRWQQKETTASRSAEALSRIDTGNIVINQINVGNQTPAEKDKSKRITEKNLQIAEKIAESLENLVRQTKVTKKQDTQIKKSLESIALSNKKAQKAGSKGKFSNTAKNLLQDLESASGKAISASSNIAERIGNLIINYKIAAAGTKLAAKGLKTLAWVSKWPLKVVKDIAMAGPNFFSWFTKMRGNRLVQAFFKDPKKFLLVRIKDIFSKDGLSRIFRKSKIFASGAFKNVLSSGPGVALVVIGAYWFTKALGVTDQEWKKAVNFIKDLVKNFESFSFIGDFFKRNFSKEGLTSMWTQFQAFWGEFKEKPFQAIWTASKNVVSSFWDFFKNAAKTIGGDFWYGIIAPLTKSFLPESVFNFLFRKEATQARQARAGSDAYALTRKIERSNISEKEREKSFSELRDIINVSFVGSKKMRVQKLYKDYEEAVLSGDKNRIAKTRMALVNRLKRSAGAAKEKGYSVSAYENTQKSYKAFSKKLEQQRKKWSEKDKKLYATVNKITNWSEMATKGKLPDTLKPKLAQAYKDYKELTGYDFPTNVSGTRTMSFTKIGSAITAGAVAAIGATIYVAGKPYKVIAEGLLFDPDSGKTIDTKKLTQSAKKAGNTALKFATGSTSFLHGVPDAVKKFKQSGSLKESTKVYWNATTTPTTNANIGNFSGNLPDYMKKYAFNGGTGQGGWTKVGGKWATVYPNGKVKVGGYRSWRNNNPGNLGGGTADCKRLLKRYAKFGAIGCDHPGDNYQADWRGIIFSTMAGGFAAQRYLLKTSYANYTINTIGKKYQKGQTAGKYSQHIQAGARAMGITMDPNKHIGKMSEAELTVLQGGILAAEGFKEGKIITNPNIKMVADIKVGPDAGKVSFNTGGTTKFTGTGSTSSTASSTSSASTNTNSLNSVVSGLTTSGGSGGDNVSSYAKSFVGKGYTYSQANRGIDYSSGELMNGATSFDCSSFVAHVVYKTKGINIKEFGATTGPQYDYLTRNASKVPNGSEEPGDIVTIFYKKSKTYKGKHSPSHTGIVSGKGKMVHSSSKYNSVVEGNIPYNRVKVEIFRIGGESNWTGEAASITPSGNSTFVPGVGVVRDGTANMTQLQDVLKNLNLKVNALGIGMNELAKENLDESKNQLSGNLPLTCSR